MSGWVRFENVASENMKIATLGDKAFRLWFHAVCYCSRAQTDGRIPGALITTLSISASARIVQELVSAGLLIEDAGDYLLHNYLDYNPSRARIREMRDGARDRTAKWRESQAGDESCDASQTCHPRGRDRTGMDTELLEEREIFDYWQERCRKPKAKFGPDRRKKVHARLAEGYSAEDIRRGIDGAAVNPPVISGVTYDDLVSVCRNGSQLERYMERANPSLRVVPGGKESPSDLLRALEGGA